MLIRDMALRNGEWRSVATTGPNIIADVQSLREVNLDVYGMTFSLTKSDGEDKTYPGALWLNERKSFSVQASSSTECRRCGR